LKIIFCRLGAELKEQASEKVDEAKDKASELASDAKQKGEGNSSYFRNKIVEFTFPFNSRSQTRCRRKRYDLYLVIYIF
jgi:hypothetical protein